VILVVNLPKHSGLRETVTPCPQTSQCRLRALRAFYFGPRSRLSVEGESTSGSCNTLRNIYYIGSVRGAGEPEIQVGRHSSPWLSH
jgi:hypothetical protein